MDAIALAHDIGHTPFGHIGERTIDAVVSGEDTLGGLLHPSGVTAMRFKHNPNAMRILVELGVKDWRIIEGALSHTRICYKNDGTVYPKDPYQPFAGSAYRKLTGFILSQNGLDFQETEKRNPPSLTLEGQIVAMADEVAQRVADLGDAKIKTRYLDNVSRMLEHHLGSRQCPEALRANPYDRIEWEIFNAMTESVAEATFKNLQKQTPIEVKYEGITHAVYTQRVAAFVEKKEESEDGEKGKREDKNKEPIRLEEMDMDQINEALDKFIGAFLAQSEDVRESDSRSKYIIRQLYKAYVNDVTLLPDAFLDDHLTRIANGNDFKEALAEKQIPEPEDQASVRDISKAFGKIKEKAWYVENAVTRGFSKKLFDMKSVKDYFDVLKTNNANESRVNRKIAVLFDAFLLDVGFYIAGMTNTEAFDAYNRIYGHTP